MVNLAKAIVGVSAYWQTLPLVYVGLMMDSCIASIILCKKANAFWGWIACENLLISYFLNIENPVFEMLKFKLKKKLLFASDSDFY